MAQLIEGRWHRGSGCGVVPGSVGAAHEHVALACYDFFDAQQAVDALRVRELCVRQQTSACVSIRQRASACVSIRQHALVGLFTCGRAAARRLPAEAVSIDAQVRHHSGFKQMRGPRAWQTFDF